MEIEKMENNEAIIIAYKWVFVRCEKYKSREIETWKEK